MTVNRARVFRSKLIQARIFKFLAESSDTEQLDRQVLLEKSLLQQPGSRFSLPPYKNVWKDLGLNQSSFVLQAAALMPDYGGS